MTAPAPADGEFVPLRADDCGATVITCPLCGGRFTHGERVCGACPLSGGCAIVRCPRCSYAFPRSSWIVDRLRRAASRFRRTAP